jgi:hypothetical protein
MDEVIHSASCPLAKGLERMPYQLQQGRLFSTAVYYEMRRTLEEEPPGRRHTVAILHIDANSSHMIAFLVDTCITRHNRMSRRESPLQLPLFRHL